MTRAAALVLLSALAWSCSNGGPTGPTTTLTVTAISPGAGSSLGGTAITISGTNFSAGLSVTVGGVPATGVTVTGTTTATAVTAPRDSGPADVVVTSGGQTASLPNAFTYVAPPAGAVPPVIQALGAQGSRLRQPPNFADLNETLEVISTVQDPGVPMTYAWTASAGAINGSGATATWRAPDQLTVPGTATLTLTVTARYSAPGPGGVTVQHNVVNSRSLTVRVHDSAREVGEMARKFLQNFSDSNVPPDVVLQDFLPNCGVDGRGREYELGDVNNNRNSFVITASTVGLAQVTVNFDGRCPFRNRAGDACAQVPVSWTSRNKSTGQTGTTSGIDQVTATYNGTRWGLCDSDYDALNVSGLQMQLFKR